MPFYETVMVLRQDLSGQQASGLSDRFVSILARQGSTVGRREYWGVLPLAYRIRKNRKGHYALVNHDSSAEAVKEMERQMRLSEDVLRYLTVKTKTMAETPSPMARSEGDASSERESPPAEKAHSDSDSLSDADKGTEKKTEPKTESPPASESQSQPRKTEKARTPSSAMEDAESPSVRKTTPPEEKEEVSEELSNLPNREGAGEKN